MAEDLRPSARSADPGPMPQTWRGRRSSRSLCKALADRLPYWQSGGLELLNRLHNASSGPGVHVDAHVVASSDLD